MDELELTKIPDKCKSCLSNKVSNYLAFYEGDAMLVTVCVVCNSCKIRKI